jgi:hypothetical protein
VTLTHTFTRTHNATLFADPHKKCSQCGDWVDGALDAPGPLTLVPCEHQSDYRDVCPSWGPLDGCTCVERGWTHEMRTPADDGKTY